MKYVALLRGINVGGKGLIKMIDLKKEFEACGFTRVSTYINSGNVLFESAETNGKKITNKLEKYLSKVFKLELRLVIRSYDQFKKVISKAPKDWQKREDLRKYITFVKDPVTPDEVLAEIKLKEDVDFVQTGPGVLYMSTLLSGLTKSGFTKLVGKKVYKNITIRNYNTTQKLLALMVK